MQKHLGFLRFSSAVVKVAGWIFLFLGILGGVSLLLGASAGSPRWMGVVILAFYVFVFFFLFLTAKIADLLVKIIDKLKAS